MNADELIAYMREPEKLGKPETELLKQVEHDFPYFQLVKVLLAKAYSNQKHYEFEKQLSKTAIGVPDRERLFHVIQGTEQPAVEESNVLEIPVQPLTVVEDQPVNEPVNSIPLAEVKPVEEVKQPEPELPPAGLIRQTEHPVVEITPVPEAPVAKVPDPTEEKKTDHSFVQEDKGDSGIQGHESETHSFIEWLKLGKGAAPVTPNPKVTNDLVESTPIIPSGQDLPKEGQEMERQPEQLTKSREVPAVEERTKAPAEEPASNVRSFENILDKFIRESPSISRPKAEFYNPANMAKQSVEEDEDLVTETLAKLYYNQGHYRKAIRAYEKLCLIYPHKMAYFADLILKIKHENKD